MIRLTFAENVFSLVSNEAAVDVPRNLEVELAAMLGLRIEVDHRQTRDGLRSFVGRNLPGLEEFFDRVCYIQSEALFKEMLLEDWGCSEDELFERVSLPGKEPICCFGAGAQGIVFMLEDGRFLKVTEDRQEAAFAILLEDRMESLFPHIDSVCRLQFGGKELYAIYREGVDDLFSQDEPSWLTEAITKAWNAAAYDRPRRPDALKSLAGVDPKRASLLQSLIDDLAGRAELGDIGVFDLHVDNIGVAEDGRYVVRDFGFNSLSDERIEDLLTGAPDLQASSLLHS